MKSLLVQNPVGWFEIHVADMQRAKAFYEAVFNRLLFPLDTGDESYAMQIFVGDVQSSRNVLSTMVAVFSNPSAA